VLSSTAVAHGGVDAPRDDAEVADGEVDVLTQLLLLPQVREARAEERGEPRDRDGRLESRGPVVEQRLGRAEAAQGLVGPAHVVGTESLDQRGERGGELGEERAGVEAHEPDRVSGHDRGDGQGDCSPDGTVDAADERAPVGIGQQHDEHRLGGGRSGEARARRREPRDEQHDEQHDRHLPEALAEHEQHHLAQGDADQDADGVLEHDLGPRVTGEAERRDGDRHRQEGDGVA
jgi:hypothetical protein